MLKRVFWFLSAVSLYTFNASSAELLASFNHEPCGGSLISSSPPPAVQYILNWDYISGIFGDIGDGTSWHNSDRGYCDFNADNTPDFDTFTSYLTDGLDFTLSSSVYVVGGGTNETGISESAWGLGNPDLFGYQIDFIRLQVHSTSLSQDGYWVDYGGNITWEFYGASTPEPSSLLLVGLGAASLRKIKRYDI
ncbi:MAG: PEP-CTERM sorting domain-containing protein [Sedimentisphaerales bacterium]|nr:PEP-CTERM sorting domain-containing protein [Sedimentisphaerales bacterium]